MSKRMTDADKWKKKFIKDLPAEYKLLWLYLLDDCDHAGVWHVDFEIAELRLGVKLSKTKAQGFFAERVVEFDNGTKWFVPDFINFQYGELTEKNKMYKPVSLVLNKYNLMGHISPINGVKVQVQVKDEVQDVLKGGVGEKWNANPKHPGDAFDLSEIENGQMVEYVYFLKRKELTADEINQFWKAFQLHSFTGKKYYADKSEVLEHFRNWIKNQKLDESDNKHSVRNASAKLGTSAARVEALKNWGRSEVNSGDTRA